MATNVVNKSLAGAEDLLRGVNSVTQIRNGQAYVINQLYVPVGVSSEAALAALNPAIATFASIVTAAGSVNYFYSPTDTTGITSTFGGSWLLDLKATKDWVQHMPFGTTDEGVLYRPGINYESAGTVAKLETRPWYHDFRPLGTAQGGDAVFSTDGANMFFGPGAGNFTMRPLPAGSVPAGVDYNLQCSHNIAYGIQALGQLTIGYKNTGIGTNAWRKLTAGHGNTAVGRDCGHELTTGNDNSFYGFTTGQLMVSGNYNCVFGVSASYNNTNGSGNSIIGRRAAFNQTTGDYNQMFGEQAGLGFTAGNYNTFIGKQASNNGLITGDSNLIIGSRVSGLQNENRQIIIADGAGNKALEIHKDPVPVAKKASYLDLSSYEPTAFSATATDGQLTAGSSIILRSLTNIGNAVTQIVFQSRVGQAFSRIVSTAAGAANMVFINDNVERLRILSGGGVNPGADNAQPFGSASRRWSEIYAGTGAINTSDGTAKEQVVELEDKEKRVAIKLKGLIRRYKFKDAVAEKQSGARLHFGIIAQDVEAAFAAEGLDAKDYGLFCLDQWPDIFEDEVVEELVTDEETGETKLVGRNTGNKIQTQVAGSRYGIRYDELLCFIIAAM